MGLALERDGRLVSVADLLVTGGFEFGARTAVLAFSVADKEDGREDEEEGQGAADDAGNGGAR